MRLIPTKHALIQHKLSQRAFKILDGRRADKALHFDGDLHGSTSRGDELLGSEIDEHAAASDLKAKGIIGDLPAVLLKGAPNDWMEQITRRHGEEERTIARTICLDLGQQPTRARERSACARRDTLQNERRARPVGPLRSVLMSESPLSKIVNVCIVDDRLGTSGQPSEAQLADIAAAGYRVVINLALHDDPRYSLPDERGAVEALGIEYVHIPVVFTAPKDEDVARFFDAMDAHRDQKLWVHCAANYRVSAFLGLYRVLRLGWDRDAAFEQLKSFWEPNEVWRDLIERALATGAGAR